VIVIPALDVLGGRVVRLMQGDYERVSEYDDDPTGVAQRFVDDGAKFIHVVDLNAARGGERCLDVVRSLKASGIRFQIGGGIRTPEDAMEAIQLGAERVVIGSALLADEITPRNIVDSVRSEAVVAAIDVRDGRVRGSGWQDEGIPLADAVARVTELGIVRALVTGIETDGTMEGPSWATLQEVRDSAPDLKMIASGGVGSIADIGKLSASEMAFEAVIVGRALYEERFTLTDAIATAAR
jgi:phosphoribosylformimino-5-aminoimidazole carboxamide ribotide isomerase